MQDELIALIPREYGGHVAQLGGAVSLVFDIVMPGTSSSLAGEIALRVGEDASLFYLGHIGYHVDPPFRGHAAALRACRLCVPVFSKLGMRSFVITTDEDNLPSIRTCDGWAARWNAPWMFPCGAVRNFPSARAKGAMCMSPRMLKDDKMR